MEKIKKEYKTPKISVLEIEIEDIIQTSGESEIISTLIRNGKSAGSIKYNDLMQ